MFRGNFLAIDSFHSIIADARFLLLFCRRAAMVQNDLMSSSSSYLVATIFRRVLLWLLRLDSFQTRLEKKMAPFATAAAAAAATVVLIN